MEIKDMPKNRKCFCCNKIINKRNNKFCSRKCANTKKNNPMFGKRGNKSPSWKGDNIGYSAIHSWVRKNKSKIDACEKCHKNRKLEISNISGKYKRDIDDYEWLCIPCHRNKDNKNGFIAKVTAVIIKKIKEDYKIGIFYQRELAKKYNLNQSTISRILNQKRGRYQC